MFETLLQSSYFALFLIIALGFMLGRIQIKGLSLDVSAVIFIALLFGHFGVIIPKELGNMGLVLFIFTIGIQAGPGFFDSFRSKGKTLIILTLLIVGSACLTGILFKYILDIDTPSIVGLIAGAFGVIGVILFVKLLPKMLRKDLIAEAKALEAQRKSQYPTLHTAAFKVTNKNICGKSLAQLQVRAMTGAVVSRIKHDNVISMPTPHTTLNEGDLLKAVGNDKALEQLTLLLGERIEGDLPLSGGQTLQSLLLTNKSIINKSLGHLNLQGTFGCTVTRVRRSGIDLSPEPNLVLKFGDKLMVAGEKESVNELAQFIGNDEKRLSDTDFFPIAMGIVLGVLFGKLNISFSDSFSFSPGLTGGILMVALVLSAIGKTGPIIWSMSGSANNLLRQLGLLLFLSEVGTSAGVNLVSTFQSSGLTLFGVGIAITMIPMIIAVLAGYYFFKINILDLVGTIAGGMTPGLAAADSMTDSPAPSVAYATVYPIAMVFLILFIQMIANLIV